MRANYSCPEGMPEPEPRPRRKSEFERIRDERYARGLKSLQEALIALRRFG